MVTDVTSRSAPRQALAPGAPSSVTDAARGSWPLLTAGLLALDAVGIVAAFALAYVIRFKTGVPLVATPPHSLGFYSSLAYWAIPAWLALFACYRLYDRRDLFTGTQEYARIANACTAGLIVVVVISFLDVGLFISRGWLLLTWALSMLFVSAGRFGLRRALHRARERGWFLTPAIIVGANEEGRALAEQLLDDHDAGLRILGFVDNTVPAGTEVTRGLAVFGAQADLRGLVHQCAIGEIVIATTAVSRPELLELYRTFGHDESVELRLSSGLFEIVTTGIRAQATASVPLVTPERVRITGLDFVVKTSLDYLVAAGALICLLPVLVAVAVLIKLDSPGPILHRRRVLGQFSKPFDAFKFRTMVINADEVIARDPALRDAFAQGYKLKVDPRVTRLGRFLRRTSLDELPQLFNVLRGEMSLVGPRMIAPDEAHRYGKWQLNLVTVKPGITGPWQVEGRSDIPYDERVRLSMQYIRNYTIWTDLEILFRTIFVVLQGKGAY